MNDRKIGDATLFAALSGPFEPGQALSALSVAPDTIDLAMVATRLADLCDVRPADAENLWLLRTSVRHSVLAALKEQNRLDTEVARRLRLNPDAATRDLLAVLVDEAPLSRAHISRNLDEASGRAELERIILALDRAGESAPSYDLLPRARAALARFHRAEKMARLAERGFFGRESEWARISEWLEKPDMSSPVGCLFLSGVPGIGKSTLLGEAVRRITEVDQPLILRLDFDRAGLDVQDQLGLTMEAARQLAEQLEGSLMELLEARVAAGFVDKRVKDTRGSRQRLPEALASSLGRAVERSGRLLLVVLDTLEVLRGRGESQPGQLLQWLDRLVEVGVVPIRVLAAGRGDALDSLSVRSRRRLKQPARHIERIDLGGLEDPAAIDLLNRLGAPARYHRDLLELAQGNPLKLRLGAELAKNGAPLPKGQRSKEVSSAFLYRLLLSRIDDPLLKTLAHPGLIVRRINTEVIRQVLGPVLGLAPLSVERAEELRTQLASHHWLVEADPDAPGYLKHRSDMRALLLPLLYSGDAATAARVDRAAMRWFASLEPWWARLESLYHRLQLSRRGVELPDLTSQDAAQFDNETLEELPVRVADHLRSLRGERSSELRGDWARNNAAQDASIVNECLTVLGRQDWVEAGYLVRSIIDGRRLRMHSTAADAVRMLLWRSGQWAEARRWLRERDRFNDSDDDLAGLPEKVALVRLEMRAEFSPDRLRRQWWAWRPQIDRLERTAGNASDDCARYGALGLLLGSLPEPYRFPLVRDGDRDFVEAAHDLWLGETGNEAWHVLEAGRRQLAHYRASAQAQQDVEPGRLLAMFTPYTNVVRHLLLLPENRALNASVERFLGAVAAAGGLFGTERSLPMRLSREDPLTVLSDLGLFADWAQSCAFIEGNQDLSRIGRSAERWRRTMAGNWSIGRRLGRWAQQPPLDQTSENRLSTLLMASNGVQQAQWQLQVWGEAVADGELRSTLRRRLKHVAHTTPNGLSKLDVPRSLTRQLLIRGVPAVFAPAVALLIMNAEL